MAKILVTGGAGFIGSHLMEELVKQGHQVTAYDNLSTGKLENISNVRDKIELIHADIRDADKLKNALEGQEIVYHLAAQVSVPESFEKPEYTKQVNLQGTRNLAEAAQGIKQIIYASTAAVYGDEPSLPKTEESQLKPQSPYAETKLAGEKALKDSGVPTTVLRFFNVYGPRQDPTSAYSGVISIFADRLKQRKQCKIYGDGNQTRDFVFVKDLVKALILAMEVKNETFVIGTGKKTSINELYSTLQKIIGLNLEPEYLEARKGDIKHSVCSIEKAKKLLGYKPETDLEKGLDATIKE